MPQYRRLSTYITLSPTIKQNIDYFPCSPLGYNVILRPLSALHLAPSAHFPHHTIPVPSRRRPARLASGVPLADAPAQIVMAVCKWHGAVPKACYYVCRKTTNSGIRKWCLEVPYCFCEWDFLNNAQSQVTADERSLFSTIPSQFRNDRNTKWRHRFIRNHITLFIKFQHISYLSRSLFDIWIYYSRNKNTSDLMNLFHNIRSKFYTKKLYLNNLHELLKS